MEPVRYKGVSAQPACNGGPKPSASPAAAGQCIQIGMRSELVLNVEVNLRRGAILRNLCPFKFHL